MPNALNLQNGGQRFNICLETNGDLSFKANAENCAGTPRVTINDDNGTSASAQPIRRKGCMSKAIALA